MNGFSSPPATSDRPQTSPNMSDLHIFVVPLEIWEEQQNFPLNQIVMETISAGFIRINADTALVDVRVEIDQQIGYGIIPPDYVFCKSVGRCLAQIQRKQESLMKVKHFLPPNSYCPEVFVVDSVIAKRSQTTPDSSKTLNSTSYKSPQIDSYLNSNGSEWLQEYSSTNENMEVEIEENSLIEFHEKDDHKNLKIELENPKGVESKIKEVHIEKDIDLINTKNEEPLLDRHLESRKNEIEELQQEIIKRQKELEDLEAEYAQKLAILKAEEDKYQKEQTGKRQMFEQMVIKRHNQEEATILKQKDELTKLNEIALKKRKEIELTEKKLNEERENHLKMVESRHNEIEHEDNKEDIVDEKIIEIKREIEEMEIKQKELAEITIKEKKKIENESKTPSVDNDNLKTHWDEDRKTRLREFTNGKSLGKRLRDVSEQATKEHSKTTDDERKQIELETARFEDEQKRWEEERTRYAKEDSHATEKLESAIPDAQENIPLKQNVDTEKSLEAPVSDVQQINNLKMILNFSIKEREESQKCREELIKKIRSNRLAIQEKRNTTLDTWKKKYLEEKQKTPPLEEQLNRFKEEQTELRKKLLASMESGVKEQNHLQKRKGLMSPSNKANLILEATQLRYDIEDLQQKIDQCQTRLSSEMKLRAQTESELKVLRIDAMQNKIRLSRTRSDQLAIMSSGEKALIHSYEYTNSPRNTKTFNSPVLNERYMLR